MGFFDELGGKISEGGSKVAEKTKNLTEITKLTAANEKEKKNLEKAYLDFAKKFYENCKDEFSGRFPEDFALISNAFNAIEENKSKIRELKGVVLCPACGKEVDKGVKFCSGCGAAMKATEETEATDAVNEENNAQ